MHNVDYRIFEYARSELEARGVLILIALHVQLSSADRVVGYLKPEWQKDINPEEDFDMSYLEDFIYDLQQLQFKPAYEVRQFFEETQGLSAGPLRTYASGECALSSLSDPTRDLLDHSHGVLPCSKDLFSLLSDELLKQVLPSVTQQYDSSYRQSQAD